jgi:hypothetical protein
VLTCYCSLDGEQLGVLTRCCLLQAGTVVMGTSFPTPYEAVVDKTKGLSVRSLVGLACTRSMPHAQL